MAYDTRTTLFNCTEQIDLILQIGLSRLYALYKEHKAGFPNLVIVVRNQLCYHA